MKRKIMIIIGLIVSLVPLKLQALTGNVILNCSSTTIKPSESTICTIKGNTNEEVSAVSIKLQAGSNLTLTNIKTDSSWQGDGEEGNIQLYTDNNKKGEFIIATFTVKANSITGGENTNIKLSNVILSDKEFSETTFNVNPLDIRILSMINTLSSLTVDGISVNDFSVDKTNYSLTVPSDKTKINIGATATDGFSKITGDIGAKTLKYGVNTFNIEVTSESALIKNYTLIVTKPEVRGLNSLSINDEIIELTDGVYEYKYTVKNEITSIELKAELNNKEVTTFVDEYGVRKVENLKEGNNEILIKIKDNNNEELTYKIIVNRLNAQGQDITTEKNPNTLSGMECGILILVTILIGGIFLLIRKRSNFPKSI